VLFVNSTETTGPCFESPYYWCKLHIVGIKDHAH
jgi:hypothetical protein